MPKKPPQLTELRKGRELLVNECCHTHTREDKILQYFDTYIALTLYYEDIKVRKPDKVSR